jgi:hypothetical protein
MNEGELRLTATHGADEFQGAFLGMETALFPWIGLGMLASLGLFVGLYFGLGREFPQALRWSLLPATGVIAYLRLGQQGKPPDYLFDLVDSLVTGGHARPPSQVPTAQLRHV